MNILKFIYYLLSFLVPPLAVCSVFVYQSISDISFSDISISDISITIPEPIEAGELEQPKYDRTKPTALIVIGNKGTEITDFLVPYQIISNADHFNVFAVAPSRRSSPLNGGLDIIPHFSLQEVDGLLESAPELIVIPNIPNVKSPEDKPIIDWLRHKDNGKTIFLSVCEGARTLAATGLLNQRRATTHWSAIGQLKSNYPQTQWVSDLKYVEDGNFITTPGVVTGSIEGSLRVVEKLVSTDKATEIAEKLGYYYTKSLNLPHTSIELSDSVWLFTALYPWTKKNIGVLIDDGVDEIELASILDTYPRSFTAVTYIYSQDNKVVRSKNNLFLVPRFNSKYVPEVDRIIDMTEPNKKMFPFDRAISDLSESENTAIARTVAKTLEYPIDHLTLIGKGWPFKLVLGPLILGFLGLYAANWFYKKYLNI